MGYFGIVVFSLLLELKDFIFLMGSIWKAPWERKFG